MSLFVDQPEVNFLISQDLNFRQGLKYFSKL